MVRRIGVVGLVGLVVFAAAVARGDPRSGGVARSVGRPLAGAAACALAENLLAEGSRIASGSSPVVRPIVAPIGGVAGGQTIAGGASMQLADPAERQVPRVAGDAGTSLGAVLGCDRGP